MIKPSVFVFADWYLPAYKGGGIITSIASLIKNLEGDYNFKILTRNTDFGSKQPLKVISFDKWYQLSPHTQINYCSRRRYRILNMVRELRSLHNSIFYINSVFSFYFSILPLFLIKLFARKNQKIIIAPMGMLAPGALQFKNFKKLCYLTISKYSGLYNNVLWHASSQIECDHIKQIFGSHSNVFIASYLFNPIESGNNLKQKQAGTMKLVYISRIVPMKNLLSVIEFLQKVNKDCNIEFDIYGPVEDNSYWKTCETEIKKLPSHIKCKYLGELNSSDVINVFQQYHFSILASHSENYGQVIPESLAAGTPVIISDNTPWRDLEQNSAGWIIPLDNKKKFIQMLEKCCKMSQEDYNKYNGGAYQYAYNLRNNSELVNRLKQLFSADILNRNFSNGASYINAVPSTTLERANS